MHMLDLKKKIKINANTNEWIKTKEAKPRKRPDKELSVLYLPEFSGSIQTIQKTKCMLNSPQNMQNKTYHIYN